MPNSINSLSPNFRDFLLNLNLITDTVTDNGLEGLLVGVGVPITNIGTTPEAVQPSGDILGDGGIYKDLNIITNQFQGTDDDYQQVNINYNSSNPSTSAFIYSSNYTDDNGILDDTTNLQPVRDFSQGGDIRQYNTSLNLYNDTDKQTIIDLNYQPSPNVQYTNYLDVNSSIVNPAIDILGSIFDGNGIGFGGGEGINAIQPNFDLRSTLLGRVLGGTGVISDTPLGQAGAKYLALALANNAAFGLQQETLGSINLNPLSLLKGDSLFVANYNITVPQGKLGKILDFGARVLGFEIPFSQFDNSSSIFAKFDNNYVSNIDRANAQISNTGKGQVLALFANIKENTYRPGFQDDRVKGDAPSEEDKAKKGSALNANIYAFGTTDGGVLDLLNESPENSPISQSNYKKDGGRGEGFDEKLSFVQDATDDDDNFMWANAGVKAPSENNPVGDGRWADGTFFDGKKTLLSKTQQLFNSGNMRTLTTGHYANDEGQSEIQSSVNKLGTAGHYKLSKGSGVLSEAAINGDETGKIFCRTWTTHDRYSQVQDLQKHSGINGTTAYREGLDESVLGDNGFVKIGPYSNEAGAATGANIKNFMFSLENLAWADDHSALLACETGPGDQLGKKGRIMWFPPYDLSVTENNSVNWDATNFIGRGEPIYTYSNTERTGTLQFKIVVDHPSYLNALAGDKGKTNEYIASFFAGCTDIDPILAEKLTTTERNEIEVRNRQVEQKTETADITPVIPSVDFFFPNDVASIPPPTYENKKSDVKTTGVFIDGEGFVDSRSGKPHPNNTNFGLNGDMNPGLEQFSGWSSTQGIAVLKKLFNEECQACKIGIKGYASIAGGTTGEAKTKQDTLSQTRADNVKKRFIDTILDTSQTIYIKNGGPISVDERFIGAPLGEGTTNDTPCIKRADNNGVDTSDFYGCKVNRKVNVKISHDKILQGKIDKDVVKPVVVQESFNVSNKIINRFYNECNYFEKLAQTDKFVYDQLKVKLKHFHPAFHAITPEGLNSRLTFLLQCTRQGPTNISGKPDNLAFGRPPICILRLGDFYHSKIAIDNVGITYEPLVWDLNPEGIGVQPMIATVDLSFKMIGGQSLRAPINKLQNAVSFNFFGNTQVYDVRADKLAKKKDAGDYVKTSGNKNNDESLGYDLIEGEKVAKPIRTTTDISQIPNGTYKEDAEVDEAKRNEEELNKNQEGSGTTGSTEIRITGIETISVGRISGEENRYSIRVSAKQQGLYSNENGVRTQLLSDESMEEFVNEGIKIEVNSVSAGNYQTFQHIEEIVPYAEGRGGKSSTWLFGLGYGLGGECSIGGNCINSPILDGNYDVSIWHQGSKIATKTIKLVDNSTNQSEYYG